MEHTQEEQLDAIRIEEISRIVTHFAESKLPVTDNILLEYCNLNKFEPIILEQYNDYKFQMEHDKLVGEKIFPEILNEIMKLKYIGTFISKIERKKLEENNEEVRVNIAKILENNNFLHRMIMSTMPSLARLIGQSVEQGGTTAWNKGREMLNHLARTHFGDELNMGHVKQYVIDMFEEKTNTKYTGDDKADGDPVA